MKPLTQEWLELAAGDLATAKRELRVTRKANLRAVCFHAHQSIEKYLKAVCQEEGLAIPKVHNLTTLLEMIVPVEPMWEAWRTTFAFMQAYPVRIRYPGATVTRQDAKRAVEIAQSAKEIVEKRLLHS